MSFLYICHGLIVGLLVCFQLVSSVTTVTVSPSVESTNSELARTPTINASSTSTNSTTTTATTSATTTSTITASSRSVTTISNSSLISSVETPKAGNESSEAQNNSYISLNSTTVADTESTPSPSRLTNTTVTTHLSEASIPNNSSTFPIVQTTNTTDPSSKVQPITATKSCGYVGIEAIAGVAIVLASIFIIAVVAFLAKFERHAEKLKKEKVTNEKGHQNVAFPKQMNTVSIQDENL